MQAEESRSEVQKLQKVLADGALEYNAAIAKAQQVDALSAENSHLKKQDEVRNQTPFYYCEAGINKGIFTPPSPLSLALDRKSGNDYAL